MKKVFPVMAFVAITVVCQAAPVSFAKARQTAVNFWNSYHPTSVKPVDDMLLRQLPDMPHLYVFTTGADGYVVVSADDCVRPVLAYSFDSPFPEELHPGLRYWLGGYEAQIAEAVELGVPPTSEAVSQWKNLESVPPQPLTATLIPTMLRTRWNQSSPYNNLCPYDSAGRFRTVVGCVATAMAQVMKYWNHPSCGNGSHSYDHWAYGTLSADFGQTDYMWDDMTTSLDFTSQHREINAIATLSYHCGVAVDMGYGESSGAWTICYGGQYDYITVCSETAFVNHFKYSPDLHGEERYHFNDSLWIGMIDADLAAGRPIIYTGSDSTGAHAFVLDGSDTNDFYHFNWGWGGYGDGYYLMSNLAPGSGGAGGNATYTFNRHQTAIFHLEPGEETFYEAEIYDTVCSGTSTYTFHNYVFTATNGATYTATHLDTIYTIHLAVIGRRNAYLDPNGAEGMKYAEQFCPVKGFTLPNCTFTHDSLPFLGWCLNKEGRDTLYQPGQVAHIRSPRTFYAIWVEPEPFVGIAPVSGDDCRLWPNPASSSINLSLRNADRTEAQLVDAMGRVVSRTAVVDGKAEIPLEGLPNGPYIIRVTTGDGQYIKRIIKQ
ncbi:MAG: thiol protease/hemagglutinin PrtT [Bacteroidales bacterium]|nr:thiol protease/hemagglutinin PrtT [Bacteroidales bacterium]